MIGIDTIFSIGAAVVSTCAKIGGELMSAVGAFAKDLVTGPIPGITPNIKSIVLGKILTLVIDVISAVADALTEKPKEETPEEIGLKAETADKKPEDFDSINDYIEYLRNDIKVDEERLKEMDEKERATYAAIGAGLYVKQVEEKYNVDLPPEFWRSTAELRNEGKISEEMPSDLIEFMKEHGIESGATFSDYLSGKLGIGSEDQQKMYDALKDTYRKEYPDATDSELNTKINTL